MSRAFVKDNEDTFDEPPDRPVSPHPNLVTPEYFNRGVQIRFRLDSPLKHAGMTDLGLRVYLTQKATGYTPSII